MTWLQFILWITGLYAAYYLLNLIMDSARSSRPLGEESQTRVLSFSEAALPEKATLTVNQPLYPEPASKASGGVNLKELFELARKDSIVHSAGISF